MKLTIGNMVKQGVSWLIIGLVALWFGGMARAMMMSPASGHLPKVSLPVLATGLSQSINTGKPQLLYLFAPWCGVCELTNPAVAQLQQQGRNVLVVAASFEQLAEVTTAVDHAGLDPSRVIIGDRQLLQQLDLVAFPTFILVDENGKLISTRVGYSPQWLLSLYLDWYGIE